VEDALNEYSRTGSLAADEQKRRAEEHYQALKEALDKKTEDYRNGHTRRMNAYFHMGEEAQHARRYEEAIVHYQKVLADCPQEAEVHWRVLMCRYGVEYVRDQMTGTYLPTLTKMQVEDILEDSDFRDACRYAQNDAVRAYYQKEGERLAAIIGKYQYVNGVSEPYDVFISVKQGDDAGRPTEDSMVGINLYHQLRAQGLRVFNSRESLKPGEEYEPYIMHALMSARTLVLVASCEEHLNARWLRNEWRRFAWLKKNEGAGSVRRIIVYSCGQKTLKIPAEIGAVQIIEAKSAAAPVEMLIRAAKEKHAAPVHSENAEPAAAAYDGADEEKLVKKQLKQQEKSEKKAAKQAAKDSGAAQLTGEEKLAAEKRRIAEVRRAEAEQAREEKAEKQLEKLRRKEAARVAARESKAERKAEEARIAAMSDGLTWRQRLPLKRQYWPSWVLWGIMLLIYFVWMQYIYYRDEQRYPYVDVPFFVLAAYVTAIKAAALAIAIYLFSRIDSSFRVLTGRSVAVGIGMTVSLLLVDWFGWLNDIVLIGYMVSLLIIIPFAACRMSKKYGSLLLGATGVTALLGVGLLITQYGGYGSVAIRYYARSALAAGVISALLSAAGVCLWFVCRAYPEWQAAAMRWFRQFMKRDWSKPQNPAEQ